MAPRLARFTRTDAPHGGYAGRGYRALTRLMFGKKRKAHWNKEQFDEAYDREAFFWTEEPGEPVANLLDYFSESQRVLAPHLDEIPARRATERTAEILARHAAELRRELADAWKDA